jgi:hypothetical protein
LHIEDRAIYLLFSLSVQIAQDYVLLTLGGLRTSQTSYSTMHAYDEPHQNTVEQVFLTARRQLSVACRGQGNLSSVNIVEMTGHVLNLGLMRSMGEARQI